MNPKRLLPFLFLLGLIAGLPNVCHAADDRRIDDNLFPPAPAAASVINFDGQGFIINGRRTFIMSGSVHYARVPREDWRDILLKLKRAGFNTVETYVFWNYHESQEGQFDFTSGSRDLGAFLDTAKSVGLYAIIRAGPYVCSEWENGGFPTWLMFKPGIEVRKDNAPYLDAVDHWWNRLLPIIAGRQIHKGGNVIMVQLENELPTDHWKYWGTNMDGAYFQHLLDLAHRNGLEVPMFFSGLHHGHDPAPNIPIDSTKRKSPWLSTELWTLWFNRYGNGSDEDVENGERHPWRVLSEGGNGFNLYMAHGGTTFGYYNFDNDIKFGDNREKGTACYDFGTLIGQSGNLTPLYYRLKRLGYQAETFSPILSHSVDSTAQYQDFAQGVKITARTAPEGTLVFLDNPGSETTATLKSGPAVKLAPGEIAAFAVNVPILPGVEIAEADTRILGIIPQKTGATVVCFGEVGDSGKVTFRGGGTPVAKTVADAAFRIDSGSILSFQFPAQGVGEEILAFGRTQLRILVMSKETADKTWFVDSATGRQIIVGAPYVGEFAMNAQKGVQAAVDYSWTTQEPSSLTVYGTGATRSLPFPAAPNSPIQPNLPLNNLAMSLAKPSQAGQWFQLPDGSPPEIGQDGGLSHYAWYIVHMENTAAVRALHFSRIGDRATFFLDGLRVAAYDFKRDKTPDVALAIPAGPHNLSVFVAYAGRRKYDGYIGALDKLESQKGLRGPVTAETTDSAFVPVTGWKMNSTFDPARPGLDWRLPFASGGMPSWYRTHFSLPTTPEPGAVYRLATDGLTFGSVSLNGHNLAIYPEIVRDCPGIWLPSCWLKAGDNELVIFDEQGASFAKVGVNLEDRVSRHRVRLTATEK